VITPALKSVGGVWSKAIERKHVGDADRVSRCFYECFPAKWVDLSCCRCAAS